ncbi:MAG: hypothetical protein K1X74_11425 [Pirellulales bacterium]|nr:hypothetical protein [Pirellulales bacterium]
MIARWQAMARFGRAAQAGQEIDQLVAQQFDAVVWAAAFQFWIDTQHPERVVAKTADAVQQAPADAVIRVLLAQAAMQTGNWPHAREHYLAALHADPSRSLARAGLVLVAALGGDGQAAVNEFHTLCQLDPARAGETGLLAARVLAQRGNVGAARAICEELLTVADDDTRPAVAAALEQLSGASPQAR